MEPPATVNSGAGIESGCGIKSCRETMPTTAGASAAGILGIGDVGNMVAAFDEKLLEEMQVVTSRLK